MMKTKNTRLSTEKVTNKSQGTMILADRATSQQTQRDVAIKVDEPRPTKKFIEVDFS